MSLGVIPIFWFKFLSDFWRNRKKEQRRKTVQIGPSPRRGQGQKMATHGFPTAKTLFTMGQNFILFPKVVYSCTDSFGTLINNQCGSK